MTCDFNEANCKDPKGKKIPRKFRIMEEKIDAISSKPDTFNCHACHKIFPDALEALDCIEKHMETVQTPIELKQDCQEIIELKSGTYLPMYISTFNKNQDRTLTRL